MNLDSSTELRLNASTSAALKWQASYTTIDKTAATAVTGNSAVGSVSAAGLASLIAAPAASITYTITGLSVSNTGTTSNTVQVLKTVAAVDYKVGPTVGLGPGETLVFTQGAGWQVFSASGAVRGVADKTSGPKGAGKALLKVGTAPEAGGVWYCWAKDSGHPGAWVPGTPGLAGRVTSGYTGADAGALPIADAASGTNHITSLGGTASQPCFPWLFDVLWVNSGAVVTTTTAQTVNSVALPARDVNSGTAGEGCWLGLLVTTATTNAAAITNMTVSYTNSLGVAGRTATLASFPATAVIGTVVWFQLAAGDTGVQSVQSLTLGTSLAAGAVSLLIARPLVTLPIGAANVPSAWAQDPGIPLPGGVTVLPFGLMVSTSTVNLTISYTIMER